jgi:hypothetical protein
MRKVRVFHQRSLSWLGEIEMTVGIIEEVEEDQLEVG